MITVVCVYNDQKKLGSYLLNSLNKQNAPYERILLDNTKAKFPSAAAALNMGGKMAHGDYILFVHQDVRLRTETWLVDAERVLEAERNIGIAGVAGKRESKEVITNIKHGTPPRPAGRKISNVETVQTIDECAMIVPKSVFKALKFDEKVCDDWHLYGVDYSLSVKNRGLKVVIIPLEAYHASAANSMSKSYYETLWKVIKKHRNNYKTIYTTMGDWNTNILFFIIRCLKIIAINWYSQIVKSRKVINEQFENKVGTSVKCDNEAV